MSRRTVWALALLVLAAALSLGAPVASAQGDPPTDDDVNRIAKQLYCPVCENVPLDVCPTQACIQWRDVIREKLAAGWTEQEIKQYFVERYGDRVLATPPARGLNWLVYVVPPALLLLGAGILFQAVRSWQRDPAAAEADAIHGPDPDDPYVARLEAELRERQGLGSDGES